MRSYGTAAPFFKAKTAAGLCLLGGADSDAAILRLTDLMVQLASFVSAVDVECGRAAGTNEPYSGIGSDHLVVSVIMVHIHCISTNGPLTMPLHDLLLLLKLVVLPLPTARDLQPTGCVQADTVRRVLSAPLGGACSSETVPRLVYALVVVIGVWLVLLHV